MRNNLILTLSVCSLALMTSCSKLGKLTSDCFSVSPNPLETVGGKVPVTVEGQFPEKFMNKKATVTVVHRNGEKERTRIKELHTFVGMGHVKTDHVDSGDICAVIGLEKFEIGDTICDFENPEPLPPIAIDEPTMSMLFTINDSPFFGKEGKFVTSRHINDRLEKELEKNLALRVRPFEDYTDRWIVSGRGVLHLSVLIETMRREGYELQVGSQRWPSISL